MVQEAPLHTCMHPGSTRPAQVTSCGPSPSPFPSMFPLPAALTTSDVRLQLTGAEPGSTMALFRGTAPAPQGQGTLVSSDACGAVPTFLSSGPLGTLSTTAAVDQSGEGASCDSGCVWIGGGGLSL